MATKEIQFLPVGESECGFVSVTNGRTKQHSLVGWQVSVNEQPTPILYPAAGVGDRILCELGRGGNAYVLDPATGKSYQSIADALGDL
jgi:hypothetical protein